MKQWSFVLNQVLARAVMHVEVLLTLAYHKGAASVSQENGSCYPLFPLMESLILPLTIF